MTQQLAVREDISPAQFDQNIEAAQHKARSLKNIVDSQGLSVRIGNSEHLKVEAWLTIAAGYGFSPRIAWSRPLPDGGYEAHAELVDSAGTVIGAGEAECGTEGDDNWLNKPAFQQRSMAQTRATVRACRNKLAWVVILAGYSPTPAEEMEPAIRDSAQTRFFCTEHQTVWFRRGKMKGYAHPIGTTGEWCNMSSSTPQDVPEDRPDAPGPNFWPSLVPTESDQPGAATRDSVIAWAMANGYKTVQEMAAVKGVQEAMRLHRFPEALQLLAAAKEGTP